MSRRANLVQLDPQAAAEELFAARKSEQGWLDAFTEHLDRQRAGESLARTDTVFMTSDAIARWFVGADPDGRAHLEAALAHRGAAPRAS